MQSNYYKAVDFYIKCFNQQELQQELEQEDLTIKTTPAGKHWRNWGRHTTLLTNEFHKLLLDINCEVLEAEVFYTAPYGILPWHIDMNPPSDNTKLNFVWGSANHSMQFGEIADSSPLSSTSMTMANSQYVEFTPLQVTPTASVCITYPTLVNSGRPHRIINRSNTSRWCLSVIITQHNRRILFNDAVKLFSEYVLN